MLRALTKQEELASRAGSFAQLRAGMLFDLGRRRSFIAVRKRGRTVEVVELDPANIDRILQGKPCAHTRLRFDDMSCLNLHAPEPHPLTGAQKTVRRANRAHPLLSGS
jgi:hypothetical protein